MTRKLEITLDVPAHLTFLRDLPDDWDTMTEAEQQVAAEAEIETIIWNRVGGTHRVVDASGQ